MPRLRSSLTVLLCAAGLTGVAVAPAHAAVSYTNCTSLHVTWPHGIGRATAHDHTSGRPVTTFRRDTRGYNTAVARNASLDRDHDGIACEKA